MSKVSESAVRSALQKPGWVQCKCQRTPCEQIYYVLPSKAGAVKFCSVGCNDEPPEIRFWKSVTKDGPEHPADPSLGCCWNSKFTPSAQYPHMKVGGKPIKASRFILGITLGRPVVDNMETLHSCDNPRCVNPAHLSEGTHKENMTGCMDRGRYNAPSGEQHSAAVLTLETVKEIQSLKANGMRYSEALLAIRERLDINKSTFNGVWYGANWKKPIDSPPV